MSEKRELLPKQLEELRIYLLIRACQAGPDGISEELLHLSAKLQGLDCKVGNVRSECQYLVDRKFLVEIDDTLCKGHRKYRIFSEGRDYLEKYGIQACSTPPLP